MGSMSQSTTGYITVLYVLMINVILIKMMVLQGDSHAAKPHKFLHIGKERKKGETTTCPSMRPDLNLMEHLKGITER